MLLVISITFIFVTIYGVVCVQLARLSIGDWNDISIAHVITIIKSEVSTFPIVFTFSVVVCLRCLFHHILSLIAYTFRENREFVFITIVQFMMSVNSRVRFDLQIVFVCLYITPSHYNHCANFIWRHWTYKMPVRYILSSVSKIKHILSVIHYTICGAVCFQFAHSLSDDWENIYTLSYYNRQIGRMNYYPLFRIRSWNNGMRCMSFYILLDSVATSRENTIIFNQLHIVSHSVLYPMKNTYSIIHANHVHFQMV